MEGETKRLPFFLKQCVTGVNHGLGMTLRDKARNYEIRNALNSGVASPKIGGRQNVWFLANNTILFRKTPLKAQDDYIF